MREIPQGNSIAPDDSLYCCSCFTGWFPLLFLLSHLIEQRLINGHEAALAHGGTGLAAELLLWPLQVMEAAAHQLLKPKLLSTYADSTAGDEDDLASFGHKGLDLKNGWHDEYSVV